MNEITTEPLSVPKWTWLIVALAIVALYAVFLENGATLSRSAAFMHELAHDARHFAAVPCH